jgi:hypothetical protein
MAINTYATLKTALENWLDRATDLDSRIPEFIALAEDRIASDTRLRVRGIEAYADITLQAAAAGGTAGGSANAITATFDPAPSSLTIGFTGRFTAANTSTSSVTLNANGLGAVALNKGDGTEALEANDIIDGHEYHVYHDGTRFRLIPRGAAPLPSRYLAARRVYLASDPSRPLQFTDPDNFWSLRGSITAGTPEMFTVEGENIIFGPHSDGSRSVRMLYYRRPAAMSADSDTNWFLANARGLHLYASLLEAAPFLEDDVRALTFSALYDDLADKVSDADRRDRHSGSALVARPDMIP